MKHVFSGIQPTGHLHLGNYLGAIRNWITMQDDYKPIFCVVDLHAMTNYDLTTGSLSDSVLHTTASYIASGIDVQKSIIFQQSDISEHSELFWLLACHTPMGWLNRMTQFKDKAGKNKEKANLGLYAYPVLMAADILLYNTDIVPAGEDQKQHIELARDIAISINNRYEQEVFTVPEPQIATTAARIMSLRDGTKKMSKSDNSDMSRINLSDDDDMIAQKIRKAKTDMEEGISLDPQNRPEITNLINIFSAITGQTPQNIVDKYHNYATSNFKNELCDALIAHLAPIRTKINELINNPDEVNKILQNGKNNAKMIAQDTMSKVHKILDIK